MLHKRQLHEMKILAQGVIGSPNNGVEDSEVTVELHTLKCVRTFWYNIGVKYLRCKHCISYICYLACFRFINPSFWEVVGLQRGPISLVSTILELLERESSDFGLENRY
jgi:hypothetical protein